MGWHSGRLMLCALLSDDEMADVDVSATQRPSGALQAEAESSAMLLTVQIPALT